MAEKFRHTLKGFFETGKIPTQAQYADLIDSNLNLSDVGVQIIKGTISASVISIPGFSNLSSSLAAAIAGGDNLGNHTAIQNLLMEGFSIQNALHITSSGNISASGLLFISASQKAGETYGVLVRDPATGRVYHTGSYGTGGGRRRRRIYSSRTFQVHGKAKILFQLHKHSYQQVKEVAIQ
jgi:hypothetical protein